MKHNTIVEKYDAGQRESEVSAGLRLDINQMRSAWRTNVAFVEHYAQLPPARKEDVLQLPEN